MSKGIRIIADSARGIYIPQHAAESLVETWQGFDSEQRAILMQGPESESYWDVWQEVLDAATWQDMDSHIWRLYQDGDLFAICPERMTDSEYESFFGEPREQA